jgi:hypothetical protein
MYGLDLTSNLLLQGFGCREEGPAVERAKKLHELIVSGKITDDAKGTTVPFIRHEELLADSELLNKVTVPAPASVTAAVTMTPASTLSR